MSLGLRLFQRITEVCRPERATLLLRNIGKRDYFLSAALAEEPPEPTYGTNASSHDRTTEERYRPSDGVNRSNYAWAWYVDYWGEEDFFVPHRASLRDWGYVMWDQQRLIEWVG